MVNSVLLVVFTVLHSYICMAWYGNFESCLYINIYKLIAIAESKKSGSSFAEFRPGERRTTEKACCQEYVIIYIL